MPVTEYSRVLYRCVRKGDAQGQVVPTYVKIDEAFAQERLGDVLEYMDFFDREAAHVYDFVFAQWIVGIGRFLCDEGMGEAELEGVCDDLKVLVNLRFDEGAPNDREAELAKYAMLKARLGQWSGIHDRDLDTIGGLLNAVVARLGEESLERLYRNTLLIDVFARGFGRFDVAKGEWSEMFDSLLAFLLSGSRLHLPDLGRDTGAITISEHHDWVEVSLTPCGNSGRFTAGDTFSGTGSHAEAPFTTASWNGSTISVGTRRASAPTARTVDSLMRNYRSSGWARPSRRRICRSAEPGGTGPSERKYHDLRSDA